MLAVPDFNGLGYQSVGIGQDEAFLYGFPFSWQEQNNRAGFNIDVLGMNDLGDGECDKGKL